MLDGQVVRPARAPVMNGMSPRVRMVVSVEGDIFGQPVRSINRS